MDPIEDALADERDQEAQQRREAERRTRKVSEALGLLVVVAFVGGVGWLAYGFVSDVMPAWMWIAIAAIAIPLAIVRAVVRGLVRKGTGG